MKPARIAGLMVLILFGGCSAAFTKARPLEEFPEGMRELKRSSRAVRVAWERNLKCTGYRMPLPSGIRFFVAPDSAFILRLGRDGALFLRGVYLPDEDTVVLSEFYEAGDSWLLRHELMHVLLHSLGIIGAHPAAFFDGKCGDLTGRKK